MPISLGFIMAFIGAAVALLIGILIFSSVNDAIVCPVTNGVELKECTQAKDTAWTIIGILPVGLFFALFAIFGGLMRGDSGDSSSSTSSTERIRTKASQVGNEVKDQIKSKMFLVMKVLGLTRKKHV